MVFFLSHLDETSAQEKKCGFYDLLEEILDGMGKRKLYDEWLDVVRKNSVTPNGSRMSIITKLARDNIALFQRGGIDNDPINKEINKKVAEEFDSLHMPIGF